jgi:D-alanine-D-alanine ligase
MGVGKIWVLGGGTSVERDVSLRSSKSVYKALQEAGFQPRFIDTRDDNSYLAAAGNDIVLPILHGSFGEDGKLQALLEERGIPFLGSGSLASAHCFDKWVTRQILTEHEIEMPKGAMVSFDEYNSHPLSQNPHVLKLVDGGSSIGTYIVRKPEDKAEVQEAIFAGSQLLIENLIIGTEITIAILDEEALPVVEIQPPVDGEFNYDNKYNGRTQELCPAVSLSEAQQSAAQEMALRVHKAMQCRHFSRVDIMVDREGDMYVLEINTIPGLTDQSLFPKAAAVSGLSMPDLCKKFVELVARR